MIGWVDEGDGLHAIDVDITSEFEEGFEFGILEVHANVVANCIFYFKGGEEIGCEVGFFGFHNDGLNNLLLEDFSAKVAAAGTPAACFVAGAGDR